ncbi:hypothetical protein [Paludisphaera rhizosphaerae]|uniref:hypothetical protein n=1 Tax=Paludisphaera rhizosphaerae TaxID=2711216 RepID=UPI0013EE042C|nr:hypothetical protein [Paludisphaera rhizosphaerae]
MLPISTDELVPHALPAVSGGGGRTAMLAVPTIRTRAKYHADLARHGLRNPSAAEVRQAVRAGIAGIVEESQRAELLEIVEQVESIASGAPDQLLRDYDALVRQLAPEWPPLGDLLAMQAEYAELRLPLACRRFLKSLEGVELQFGPDGALTEAALERLGWMDAFALGLRIMDLLYLPADAEKNSESPSPSPGTPANSAAADGPPTGSTAGTSSATGTTKTPGSA